MFVRQPVQPELIRKEEASCNAVVQLFIVTVARELDHLAAIKEWRDGVKRFGLTDESSQKINQHVNVMTLLVIHKN